MGSIPSSQFTSMMCTIDLSQGKWLVITLTLNKIYWPALAQYIAHSVTKPTKSKEHLLGQTQLTALWTCLRAVRPLQLYLYTSGLVQHFSSRFSSLFCLECHHSSFPRFFFTLLFGMSLLQLSTNSKFRKIHCIVLQTNSCRMSLSQQDKLHRSKSCQPVSSLASLVHLAHICFAQ
jgi:hypothetical protein